MSAYAAGLLVAFAPLLALVCLLLSGRYPGEAAIERCRRALIVLLRCGAGRGVNPAESLNDRIPGRRARPIAHSLAGRGPPPRSGALGTQI